MPKLLCRDVRSSDEPLMNAPRELLRQSSDELDCEVISAVMHKARPMVSSLTSSVELAGCGQPLVAA
eukprot:6211879-Pleurochrysis_carterae.AAC.1